jgi:hypothetical protein
VSFFLVTETVSKKNFRQEHPVNPVEECAAMPKRAMSFPITMYKEDPANNHLAEYYSVLYARDPQGYALVDLHGWWEEEQGKPHFNQEVLSEPHKTPDETNAAMDERVAWLEKQGWTFKLTAHFDPDKGGFVGLRIP